MYVAKLMYHRWEEEPISGIEAGYKGTFAIFFYGCNLRCAYCQNSKISRAKINELHDKKDTSSEKMFYTPDELSDEMIKAEKEGAYTISFITGVFYYDEIVETIKIARNKGLKLPIVYNSSGYEFASHIKKFEGLVDIYLPDFKYYDNEIGKKYSHVSNYCEIAKECIEEMYRQVGESVIVRHLILPSHTEDSKKIIEYLYKTYGDDIRLSIMSQYTPMLQNEDITAYPELQRKLTKREYHKVVDYALSLGVKNAFIQEGDVANESFIPEFTVNRYIVRDFRDEDADELSKMIREDIEVVNTEDPEWEREYLYKFYTPANIIEKAKTGHMYVIEDTNDGTLVATGMIKKDSPAREGAENESEISACFVSPNKLRQGLGTLLFDALENDSAFRMANRIWLTTSVYAAPFYEDRGYKYVFGYRKKNQDNLTEMEKVNKENAKR